MKTHTVSCMGIPFVIVEAMPQGMILLAPPPRKEPPESFEEWAKRCVVAREGTSETCAK